ncbi:MAG TPA: S9 family peptidase [Symbiobacteriaceae bacterium]|jgi:dipeptidyl aminopeptidase/acylaminoacyl peptidase
MAVPQTAPYGTWRSPITADLVTAGTISLEEAVLDGDDIYWSERRPFERGRSVIVRRTPDGQTHDLTPPPYNVRSRVHEYGGGAFTVVDGTVYFANFADQFLYRVDPGGEPRPVHAHPGFRFADCTPDRPRHRLIAVCEDHSREGGQPVNTLVALGMDGGPVETLVSGNDFYASPRLSPDGVRLAWLTWNHPNMPWDGTELWVGEIAADGRIEDARWVAGGPAESVFQPEWSPDGVLHFVSDRTGWWNLYRLEDGQAAALCPMAAEFGVPQWLFGRATYAMVAPTRIICAYTSQGSWQLASLDTATHTLTPIPTPYTAIDGIRGSAGQVVFSAGSPTQPTALLRLDLHDESCTVLRRSVELAVDPAYLSPARPVSFPTEDGLTAHGLFYPPVNGDCAAPAGERPPLIVLSHGGPTGTAPPTLNLAVQYWTSRGFAILDVNYGGSTGYGRPYRERLKGRWGIVDVDDCVNGALHLVGQGLADGARLIIRGGSAGGYTTLAALTFRNVFRAGVSLYGVGDLETLAADTHKFESRYLDGLVGPYPAARETYRSRSPIHYTEHLACPVIFFQGLDDKVVPPNQAEAMVAAVKAKGIPVAYVPFAGEGHGFRQAQNNRRALEAQLYFFGQVFGFTPADPVEPVAIANL